jgi:hypothetical protein
MIERLTQRELLVDLYETLKSIGEQNTLGKGR